jgi:arylsulfatase
MPTNPPNVLFFHVDNLGYGELGCYGGGILRGADTKRIDTFAQEGFKLLNYAPEAQCSPTRAALMTGRYSIRSGNTKATAPGMAGGLVAWEKTLGDLFSEAGYATLCMGKWHIGDDDGRWPTDHGFDEWYGPPYSWDPALWTNDPWYDPKRDVVEYMHEGRRDEKVVQKELLDYDLKINVDDELNRRTLSFIEKCAKNDEPFFIYHNHSLMHFPVVPREEYRGKSGHGDWADCLLQLDGDFGLLLDKLDELGLREHTIVIFAGDNGNEEIQTDRGTAGFWEGSYFTGMEGSLRTPCIVRWPSKIPAGLESNEIMHCTDWFTTLATVANIPVPDDRIIDGIDQSAFLSGKQKESDRQGFLFWNSDQLYGVKWRNFKIVLKTQKYLSDPALDLPFPHIINLDLDPKEREPFSKYLHTWVIDHCAKLITGFVESTKQEELIKPGAPLDFVPKSALESSHDDHVHTVKPG